MYSNDSLWKERTLRVVSVDRATGRTSNRLLPVKVFGKFGVYPPSYRGTKGYEVIHLPSGLFATETTTEADALEVGAYLWRKFSRVFAEEKADAVREKAPEWLKRYLRAVRKAGRFLPPEDFWEDANA